MAYISIGGVHAQVSAFPRTQQDRILSCDFLDWISAEGSIPCSFANFITTPELSGPFYTSPDNYHTQISEYLLLKIYK
jgi:hypothetical protein